VSKMDEAKPVHRCNTRGINNAENAKVCGKREGVEESGVRLQEEGQDWHFQNRQLGSHGRKRRN